MLRCAHQSIPAGLIGVTILQRQTVKVETDASEGF